MSTISDNPPVDTSSPADKALAGGANWVDERFGVAKGLRKSLLNKVFPDHWSFLLGEIALYSFVILLITGTYLTFFFVPSLNEVVYNGSYTPLRGIEMSQAYASSLNISFDVRGGLIIRQIHHWAALVFFAAMVVHMARIFFTGAYRKPREINWLIGIGLITLTMLEGLAGYSLPDDLLSGTGLRIFNSVILSVPVVGTWISFLLFGGEFPGTIVDERLYIAHVFLVPGLLLGLIAAHLAILVSQKHTQFPGPGRTEKNVVGVRMFPLFMAQGGGFFMIVFAVLAGLGGLAQINPIWLYGPYDVSQVSAGSQPDWYIGFMDGLLRVFPAWEIRAFGLTLSPIFWAAVVGPGVLFTLAGAWPFIEQKLTGDRTMHHLLQRPRDAPTRTALGAMAFTFYGVLMIVGGNDVIGSAFHISIFAMIWGGRIGLLVLPAIAYWLTQRICLGLQQHDREVLTHGVETGIIRRSALGEFTEAHQPLGDVDEHGHAVPIEYDGSAVPKKMNRLVGTGRAVKGFFGPLPGPDPQHAEGKSGAGQIDHSSDNDAGGHSADERELTSGTTRSDGDH